MIKIKDSHEWYLAVMWFQDQREFYPITCCSCGGLMLPYAHGIVCNGLMCGECYKIQAKAPDIITEVWNRNKVMIKL